MTTATESRPSWTNERPSWTSDERITLQPDPPSGTHERLRAAIPSPEPRVAVHQRRKSDGPDGVKHASSMSPRQTSDLVESLQVFVERMQTIKDEGDHGSLMDSVRKFARSMQQKVAKLGGTSASARTAEKPVAERRSRSSIVNGDDADRPSFSCSLDGYRPDVDVVAPISVRPNAMELLWVCGDCGEHYPRARQCPETCVSCGAPKQNFYAPIED